LTPTSDPHEAQTTEPVFWRWNIVEAYNIGSNFAGRLPRRSAGPFAPREDGWSVIRDP
jgi:hypothetical protein